jgi:copper transport protein
MRAHRYAPPPATATAAGVEKISPAPSRRQAQRPKAFGCAFMLALLAAMAWAPSALAHAQLVGTSPPSGATVKTQPKEVIFKYNQAVGGTVGAVRVYDAQGSEVDNLEVGHPGGHQSWMGVGLKPNLPDGTYTATYRVISADTHIVYGGLVFSIGHPGKAPKYSVASLIGRGQSGEVTKLAFGATRMLDYLSIALMIGALAFLTFAWRPGLASASSADPAWSEASRAFGRRLGILFATAVVLGVAVSLLGILLQGASAAGVSLWASLKGSILDDTLSSRFGTVWMLRAADWVALGLLLLTAWRAPGARRWLSVPIAAGAVYLAMTPALAGHASIESPVVLFFPVDFVHVLSASAWVGGIACLLVAMPAATRRVAVEDRTRLLLATLRRFSPIALGAVIAIAITGVVQAYIDVRTLDALFNTTYGLLVVAKVVLLLALIGLGWVNRQRIVPALKRLVERAAAPGAIGAAARRSFRAEIALMLVVFGVTAALVSYAPPIDAANGPFAVNTTLGPAELEMTVEPARVGLNTIHLYLIDAKTGAQFTGTKQLTVTAALPSKQIGPLPLTANVAGPGHYVLDAAQLTPGGTWQIQVTDRVSAFDQYSKSVSVPIR